MSGLSIAIEKEISALDESERALLLERRPTEEPSLRRDVAQIVAEVRERGDAALVEMARRFDGVELASIEVPRGRWAEALGGLDREVRTALRTAARNIRRFHQAQIPEPLEIEMEDGVVLGRSFTPLKRAGVYAPGGRAAYPSSVLMGVIPAVVAGVGEVVVCSPPGPDGEPPREVLAACAIAEADRLFAIGGAGAIAALVYGTESVPRAAAVVGPGNRWVTEAKRQLAGEVVIDSPAGPSEVLVLADGTADPDLVALELLAQAEHDPDAAVALVTTDGSLAARVRDALARQVASAPRREIMERALAARGALLTARSVPEAVRFAEEYAPEHLAIFTRAPRWDREKITTSGTIFLGPASSVAFGDYMTGANHVLPTGGLARSFSGLSTQHFLRGFTWQEVSPEAAERMSAPVERLAMAEGLPGHAAAARARGAARSAGPAGEDP